MANEALVLLSVHWPEEEGATTTAQGGEPAMELHRILTEEVSRKLLDGVRRGSYRMLLHATPANRLARVVLWLNTPGGPVLDALPQPEGPLGCRLRHAMEWGFRKIGAKRLVIAGTQCPGLDAGHVERALDALDKNDLVLGRTDDGRFHALATRVDRPEIFDGLDQPEVESLPEKARGLGLRVDTETFPLLPEITTPGDLTRLDGTLRERLHGECIRRGMKVPGN